MTGYHGMYGGYWHGQCFVWLLVSEYLACSQQPEIDVNSLSPERYSSNFICVILQIFWWLISWAYPVKPMNAIGRGVVPGGGGVPGILPTTFTEAPYPPGDHRTSLMINPHCFGHQAISWTNISPSSTCSMSPYGITIGQWVNPLASKQLPVELLLMGSCGIQLRVIEIISINEICIKITYVELQPVSRPSYVHILY